jgi:hypothetical protein
MQPTKKVLGVKRIGLILSVLLLFFLLFLGCTQTPDKIYIIKKDTNVYMDLNAQTVKQTIKLNDLNDVTAPYCSTKQFLGCDSITGGWKPITIFDPVDDDTNYLDKVNLIPQSIKSDINFDGNILFVETYWDDIRVPVSSVKQGILNPATVCALTGNTYVLCFDNLGSAQEQDVTFLIQVPHNYKFGSQVEAHIHYAPASNTDCNAVWDLEYTSADIWGVFPATNITQVVTIMGNNNINKHLLTSFGNVGVFNNVSGILAGRLTRRSANALDTCTVQVKLLEIDFHYEIDSIGSRSIVTK